MVRDCTTLCAAHPTRGSRRPEPVPVRRHRRGVGGVLLRCRHGSDGRRGAARAGHGRGVERLAARAPRRSPGRVAGLAAQGGRPRPFSYEEAVLEALRYGWVDSTVKPVDDARSMQWFAPAARGQHVDPDQQGPDRPPRGGRPDGAGRRGRVALAKETGMWTLMDDVEDLVVPADLAAAFDRHPGSREHWESWSPSAQKMILTWIVLAKRPETRAARIETTAEKAARGREVAARQVAAARSRSRRGRTPRRRPSRAPRCAGAPRPTPARAPG